MPPVIAMVGQDGAGKSTQIAMVRTRLRAQGFHVRAIHQQEPASVLEARLLRVGTAWVRRLGRKVTQRPGGVLTRVLGELYALVAVGKAWARWGRRSGDEVVLLDRTIVDEQVRLEFRLGVRSRVLAVCSRWRMFTPDVTIGLQIDASLGQARKKTAHLSVEEYRRKMELTRTALAAIDDAYAIQWIAVDDLTVSEVHAAVMATLIEAGIVL